VARCLFSVEKALGIKLNGGGKEHDLVCLRDERGQVLARLYLDNPGNGTPRSIRLEVMSVTEPFNDLRRESVR